jgi:hypothetical protein
MAACACMGCPHPANCRCRCETCKREAAQPPAGGDTARRDEMCMCGHTRDMHRAKCGGWQTTGADWRDACACRSFRPREASASPVTPPAPPVPVGLDEMREVTREQWDSLAALRPSPSAPAPDVQEGLRDELRSVAEWIREPGNVPYREETINECARLLEMAALRQPVSPAPESREALEVIWDALLAANRMSNVLYNLPMRYKVDGTLNLTGKDMDDLRRVRLEWEVAERAALGAIRPMRAALASPAARREED